MKSIITVAMHTSSLRIDGPRPSKLKETWKTGYLAGTSTPNAAVPREEHNFLQTNVVAVQGFPSHHQLNSPKIFHQNKFHFHSYRLASNIQFSYPSILFILLIMHQKASY